MTLFHRSPDKSSAAFVLSPDLRGILWMLGAVLTLTAMFAILKQLVTELPIFVVTTLRTLFGLIALFPWLYRAGLNGLATKRLSGLFLRSVFGTSAFICLMVAFSHLIFADAMVLGFTTPLWSMFLSALFLGEALRLGRIASTIVGFIGVIFVIKPQAEIDPVMFVALFSAILGSCATIMLKKLSATEPPERIVFYFLSFGVLFMSAPAIYAWQMPSLAQWAWLIAAGILTALGQSCLARAYSAGEVSIVSPINFLRLPLAALIGFIAFAEIPDIWTGIGTTLIIASSIFLARHEAWSRPATVPGPSGPLE